MSKSVDIFFPLYIGDYQKKTILLSCEEHGAYLLLLMSLYQSNGSIPYDKKRMARACRLSLSEFNEIWEEIEKYFDISDGKVSNKRVSKEIQKAMARKKIASQNGKKGGRPRNQYLTQEKPSGLTTEEAKANPQKSSSPSPSPSPSHTKPPKPSGRGGKKFSPPNLLEVSEFIIENEMSISAERFFSHYESVGWMVGKNKMKDWKAAARGWQSRESSSNSQKEKTAYEILQERKAKRARGEIV